MLGLVAVDVHELMTIELFIGFLVVGKYNSWLGFEKIFLTSNLLTIF